MNWTKWQSMTEAEKKKVRDLRSLSPQLSGLEGWRVEVETVYGTRRRFIVGRSTGWRPIHIELLTRRSMGGSGAEKKYKTITRLYNTR